MPVKRSPKAPLPVGVIWWRHLKRHPLHEALGLVVHGQRKRRGWSLDDLSLVTGISKSHLWDLENGLHNVSLEMIERLEVVFRVVPGGLVALARRRLKAMPAVPDTVRSI